MRQVVIGIVALAACVCGAPARAELCPKCKERMYTTDIGTCVHCGGHTSSGAFKLCRECSAKLGQCECCRAALGSAKPAPPPAVPANAVDLGKPGAYERPPWKYKYDIRAAGTRSESRFGELTYGGKPIPGVERLDRIRTPWGMMQYFGPEQPRFGAGGWVLEPMENDQGRLLLPPYDAKTAARVKALNGDVHAFTLELHYVGPADKPLPGLSLRVPFRADPSAPAALQITKEEAAAIIVHLADDGFVARAVNVAQVDIQPPRGPTYTLRVAGPEELVLFESFGWNLAMLRRLDALRRVLDGHAGKAMDAVLARLSGLRKQWEASQ